MVQPTRYDGSEIVSDAEQGQAAVALVLILGLFLLGAVGLGVDLTNVWFHRQAAQAAADAACQAGAMDMLASNAGLTPPASGFTLGTANNCVGQPSATMCTYAAANGYSGTGLVSGAASNSVSWTFPSSVTGVTSQGPNSFLKVSIAENIRTYLMSLVNASKYITLNVSSTCGLVQVKAAAPMLVLSPTASGALTYSGGGGVAIAGGPSRSLQVNSSSASAVSWSASGLIDLHAGGPNGTGSDIGIVGGPSTAPTNGSSNGYNGGTTGTWKSNVLPLSDPYGSVPAPSLPANAPAPVWVEYGIDGCPDKTQVYQYYDSQTGKSVYASCPEYSPGLYPSGITLGSSTTAIFKPGVYYMKGSLNAGASATLRMAKPSGYQQTDGVMFYFLSGSLNISGCSGCVNSNVDNVQTTDLTCDGSAPPASLNMPTSISGNVLWAQCATNGTYWDSANDTTDSRGAPGSRGLLVFEDHANATTQTAFTGSGQLSFSGSIYLHSSNYLDVFNLSGGTSSGTYVLGEIVADQVQLTGSGMVKLALNPAATIDESKAALLQ